MKNLQNALSVVENVSLKVANEKINQVQRNQIKADLLKGLIDDLAEIGYSVNMTKEGLVLTVENEVANVYVLLDLTIKNLDFDLQGAVEDLKQAIEDKHQKEIDKQLAKEKREKEKVAKK